MDKRKIAFLERNALLKRNVFNTRLITIAPAQKAGFFTPIREVRAESHC